MKQISIKYPSVNITLANYENLVSTLKSTGEIKYSQVVRPLLYGLLSKDSAWETASSMYTQYPEELAACLGYFYFSFASVIFYKFVFI